MNFERFNPDAVGKTDSSLERKPDPLVVHEDGHRLSRTHDQASAHRHAVRAVPRASSAIASSRSVPVIVTERHC